MKKFLKSKHGLITMVLLGLATIAVAAGVVRWQPVDIVGSGNIQGLTGSYVIRGMYVNLASGPLTNVNLQMFDSASGATGTAGAFKVLSTQVPTGISITSAAMYFPFGDGMYIKQGLVVEAGSNTIDATFLVIPAN